MTIEKRTLRTDIPGHEALLSNQAGDDAAAAEATRMVVGRDIVLKGDIAACEHLVVDGVVEAKMLSTQQLDLSESGVFLGVAETQDACIAGRFEGHLTVRGQLTLKASAIILGNIEYGSMAAEAGCRLEVSLRVLDHVQQEMDFIPTDFAANDAEPVAETADAPGVETEATESDVAGLKVFRRSSVG